MNWKRLGKLALFVGGAFVVAVLAALLYFNRLDIDWIALWRDIITYWPHVGPAIIVVLTIWLVKLAREQRKARIEEGMPELVLSFAVQNMDVLLILKNLGQRRAMNVSVTSSPPLRSTINGEVFLKRGHSSLPPNGPIVFKLASSHEISEHDGSVPLDYDVTITYTDRAIHGRISREQHLTLRDFLGTSATAFPPTL